MSEFSFQAKEENDIIIINTSGYINNIAAENIADSCYEFMEKGFKKFLINLEDSKIINSIGISIFLEIIEKLQDIDGKIGFYNLASIVQKAFRIMGLEQYSEIFDSEESAIKGMS